MNEARQAVPSRCSKPPCKNCRRWTASMPALRMAPGCRCGASATLPKSSANACGRLRMRTSRSISFAPPRRAICRYGGYFRISKAMRSMKSIYGNMATTPVNVPGTGRRCRRTDHTFQSPIFLSVWRAGHHRQRAAARQGAGRDRCRSQARYVQRVRPGPAARTAWHGHDLRPGRITHRPPRIFRSCYERNDAPGPIVIAQHRRD